MRNIIKGIKTVFQDSLSYKVAVISSLTIAYLFYWLLYKVTTISTMFQNAKDGEFGQYSYAYFATYWTTTLATIILFGISASILVWLWRRSLLSKVSTSSSGLGAFVGALGAACPICGAFLLSLLGVSAGVSIFPLQGLELKFLSLGLIAGSTAFAASRVTKAIDCGECADISKDRSQVKRSGLVILPLEKILIFGLAVVDRPM